jgi:hypothetical protein
MALMIRIAFTCLVAALIAPACAAAMLPADAGDGHTTVPRRHVKSQQQKRPRPARRRQAVHPKRTARPAPPPASSTPRPGLSDFTTPAPPRRHPARRRQAVRPKRTARPAPPPVSSTPRPGLSDFTTPTPTPTATRRPASPRHRARPIPQRRRSPSPAARADARRYLDSLEQVEQNDGALNLGLAQGIALIHKPGVEQAVRKLRARRRAQAVVRSRARLYLRGLDALADGHGKTQSLAAALAQGSDPTVRAAADRIIARRDERRRARRRLRRQRIDAKVFANVDGPDLTGYQAPAGLPFPGTFVSADLGCERRVTPRAETACLGLGGRDAEEPSRSFSVSVDVTSSTERSGTSLSSDGKALQSLSLSTDTRVTGSAEFKRGPWGGGIKAFTGHNVSYTADLTPARAQAVSDRTGQAPTPLDPRTLQPGESLELNKEDYVGNGQSVNYELVEAEVGHTDGRRVSSGVQRIDDGTVRIYVGDEKLVTNALALSVGNDDLGATVDFGDESSNGRMRTADLDISTPAGWRQYQTFVNSGRLPASRGPGLKDSTVSGTFDWSSSRTLEGHVGPITVGGSFPTGSIDISTTLHMNGSREQTQAVRDGNITTVFGFRKHGRSWPANHLSLVLQDTDGGMVGGLLQDRGRSADVGGSQNVMINFTPAQLMRVRQNAVDELSKRTQGASHPLSPAQIDELMRGHPGATLPDYVGGGDSYLRALAQAARPTDVLNALSYGALRSSSALAMNLHLLEVAQRSAPGSVVILPD